MKHLPKDGLKWVAAAFALAATATAEYEIARAIGMNQWIAAAVPGALDAYVVRALRAHREVLAAVIAMVGVNAASHLVTAGILPVEWPLITAVSAIAPLVLWRVHALGTPGDWRARKIWGLSKAEHAAVLASTEPEHTEHERAPDNPEPPGTREHPEHAAVHAWTSGLIDTTFASTDDLDVPDWVNPPSTPPVPVHAPYADHVLLPDLPSTRPMPARHLAIVGKAEMLAEHDRRFPSTPREHWCGESFTHREHEHGDGLLCLGVLGEAYGAEHTASTRTADDWNLEHVSTGVLEPDDTVHMERARELFHTIGGVPPFRALKEGEPGMGTPRAKRIRAALLIEAEGTD